MCFRRNEILKLAGSNDAAVLELLNDGFESDGHERNPKAGKSDSDYSCPPIGLKAPRVLVKTGRFAAPRRYGLSLIRPHSSGSRDEAGLSQEKLAFTAEIDRSYVSLLENDKKSPTAMCCSGCAMQ
jgi:hypothetical protein